MGNMTVYALSPTVVCRRTQPHLVMAFDRSSGVMYELNETASSVVLLLDGRRTYDEVLSQLADDYDAEPATMATEVDELLDRLLEVRVISRVMSV